jgi:hypothetical protein
LTIPGNGVIIHTSKRKYKMTLLTINPTSFGEFVKAQNELIGDTTKTNTGVFRRFTLALTFIIEHEGMTMDKATLKAKMHEINAIAYPKQDVKSHNLWAGKAVASMIKNGIAIETTA